MATPQEIFQSACEHFQPIYDRVTAHSGNYESPYHGVRALLEFARCLSRDPAGAEQFATFFQQEIRDLHCHMREDNLPRCACESIEEEGEGEPRYHN